MAKKTKIIFGISLIALAVFGLAFFASNIYAGTEENGAGWLWGGTEDGSGGNTGLGWVSMNSITDSASTSYGVNIPLTDGSLSGYAWSENVGWINFNGASRSGNNIIGSAIIQGIADEFAQNNSGGWEGRISLSGTAQNGSSYGVSINPDSTLAGYAWSDEFGWIDFSRALIMPCVASSYTYSCFDGSACGNCGQVETTNPWTCAKLDNCGISSIGTQAECQANSISCLDTVCPKCEKDLNWREVSPY